MVFKSWDIAFGTNKWTNLKSCFGPKPCDSLLQNRMVPGLEPGSRRFTQITHWRCLKRRFSCFPGSLLLFTVTGVPLCFSGSKNMTVELGSAVHTPQLKQDSQRHMKHPSRSGTCHRPVADPTGSCYIPNADGAILRLAKSNMTMEKIDMCRHFFYQSLYLHWISQRSDCTLSASLKRKGHCCCRSLGRRPRNHSGAWRETAPNAQLSDGSNWKWSKKWGCLTSTTSRDMWLYLKWGIYIQYGQFHLGLSENVGYIPNEIAI